MNMDFNKRNDRADWERLNKFLLERQSQTQSDIAAHDSQLRREQLNMEATLDQ